MKRRETARRCYAEAISIQQPLSRGAEVPSSSVIMSMPSDKVYLLCITFPDLFDR